MCKLYCSEAALPTWICPGDEVRCLYGTIPVCHAEVSARTRCLAMRKGGINYWVKVPTTPHSGTEETLFKRVAGYESVCPQSWGEKAGDLGLPFISCLGHLFSIPLWDVSLPHQMEWSGRNSKGETVSEMPPFLLHWYPPIGFQQRTEAAWFPIFNCCHAEQYRYAKRLCVELNIAQEQSNGFLASLWHVQHWFFHTLLGRMLFLFSWSSPPPFFCCCCCCCCSESGLLSSDRADLGH